VSQSDRKKRVRFDHVWPNTDRYKRLERIEGALKVRSTKWKEAISIANQACTEASEKSLCSIGVGNRFWCIENAADVHLQAEFFDKNKCLELFVYSLRVPL